jgi:hypothetical protein
MSWVDQGGGKRRSVTALCHIDTPVSVLVGRTGDDAMHYLDYITFGIALALAVSLIAAYAFGSLPLPP